MIPPTPRRRARPGRSFPISRSATRALSRALASEGEIAILLIEQNARLALDAFNGALAAIWAAQAGKHVYVEKPASHNIWEGRQLVEAARRYPRNLVVAGTQNQRFDYAEFAEQFRQQFGYAL